MNTELLACGCGGEAVVDLTDFEWAESRSFHVRCRKCGIRTPVGTARSPISEAKAVRVWQKSRTPAEPKAGDWEGVLIESTLRHSRELFSLRPDLRSSDIEAFMETVSMAVSIGIEEARALSSAAPFTPSQERK